MSRAIENKFADNVPAWHGMAGPPGEVQESYKEHDLPNLPVMVVDQQKRRPAEGWYAQFDLLYPELAQVDNVEKRNKAKDSVLACTDWVLRGTLHVPDIGVSMSSTTESCLKSSSDIPRRPIISDTLSAIGLSLKLRTMAEDEHGFAHPLPLGMVTDKPTDKLLTS